MVEARQTMIDRSDGPIHLFFGLSYASYLVLPRTLLQSMPHPWQAQFVALLSELDVAFAHVETAPGYVVRATDLAGKFIKQPVPPYDRGRAYISPRRTEDAVNILTGTHVTRNADGSLTTRQTPKAEIDGLNAALRRGSMCVVENTPQPAGTHLIGVITHHDLSMKPVLYLVTLGADA